MFFQNLNNFWTVIELLVTLPSFLLSIFIFFRDPLRRWRFFGFRPTAILVLYDSSQKKVLLTKKKVGWAFAQGGIYDSNISQAVEQIAKRELDFESNEMQLRYIRELGTIAVKDPYRTNRVTIGGINLFPHLRGKGYIACFVASDFKRFLKNKKISYSIEAIKPYSIKDARRHIKYEGKRNSFAKANIIKRILDELEGHFEEIDNYKLPNSR